MSSPLGSQTYGSLETLTSTLLSQASNHASRVTSVASLREKGIKCCCEQDCCAFFQESTALLMELEKDVQTAASLGQALLERHEKSLLEGTQERGKLRHAIEELENRNANLETENHDLDLENQKKIEENRRLLVQLEEYNQGMSMNEIKVREMQGDLDALHGELARVATAAARTEILEAQLQALESEQTEMRNTITRTKEDERAAVARWKHAEKIIADLTAEVERIEREHRMEKARAQNLMDRLEKRQIVNRKAGELPSALAERTAMSQFMRDILAENNHLQSALSELRDMLLTSQEEVGALREQLMELGRVEGAGTPTPLSRELPVDAERLPVAPPAAELHYHHHVHKEKVVPRRVKRRGRAPLALDPSRRSMTTPNDIPSTPATPGSARMQRWSQLSGHMRSSSGRGLLSYSSSPQSVSTFRDSIIFDRDYGVDSTRPSTADTEWDSVSVQKSGDRSRRRPRDSTGGPPFSILYTEEIPENLAEDESCDDAYEREAENLASGSRNVHADTQFASNGVLTGTRPPSPGGRSILRKSASHESLLVPAAQMYQDFPSISTASFNPTSPAAIAAAAASKDQAIFAHKRARGGASSAAYNHLHLLAGGNIRGKGPARANTSGSSRNGWFGGWGWSAKPFGATVRITAPTEDSETESSSVATPTSGGRSPAVSIAGFKSKGTPAEAVLAGEMVSTGTSPARSVQSVRTSGGVTAVPVASKPVPIAVYRDIVDEQLLRESMLDSMQM